MVDCYIKDFGYSQYEVVACKQGLQAVTYLEGTRGYLTPLYHKKKQIIVKPQKIGSIGNVLRLKGFRVPKIGIGENSFEMSKNPCNESIKMNITQNAPLNQSYQ